MSKVQIAKLFKNSAGQVVQLPPEFSFEGDKVYIMRDDTMGDVVLSNRPSVRTWQDFFDMVHNIDVPDDFMAERPMNVLSQEKNIFDDEDAYPCLAEKPLMSR